MKIVGMAVIGPNEKYLKQTLNELRRLCDDVVVATNDADQKTKNALSDYGFWHYEDNREWGIYQPEIKTDLLKRVGKLNPDWIIALDADEKFAPEFTREEAEKLARTKEVAYYFLVVNLYNDKDHQVHGTGIQSFWNIRFFKYLSEDVQYQHKRLHCGLAPPIFYYRGWHAPFYLEHYGLMLKEDRLRKAERYKKYDPTGKFKSMDYYNELTKELTPKKFDRAKLLEQLKNSSECKPRKL